MDNEDDAQQGVIAHRLNHLWETCQPLGRPYTLKEAADGINEAAGEQAISMQYLSQLRNGTRAEPAHSKLAAIAHFFGVPVGYFTDEETMRHTDEELRMLRAMRDSGVRDLALRAEGLSPQSMELIRALVEQARRQEGLPDADGES
jgi:transcriptional regulator with XRE-family HTH domain